MGTHEAKPNEKQKRAEERKRLEKKDSISSMIFGGSFLAFIILFPILKFADIEDGSPTAIVLAVLLLCSMICFAFGFFYSKSIAQDIEVLNKKDREDRDKLIEAKKNSAEIVYENYCKELNRPQNPCESDNSNLWIYNNSY